MKMTTMGLVLGRLSLISIAAFSRASASALKLVEYFPVAVMTCVSPSLYCMYPPQLPHLGWLLLHNPMCRQRSTGLLATILGADILQRQ